jgi:hypothetical protein
MEHQTSRSCLLYAGTEDGVFVFKFRAINDGMSAERNEELELVGRGIEGNAVRSIAIHPHRSDVAYIGCGLRGWGLYRTTNAGSNFESLGFQDRWVWEVAFHPTSPSTFYVGTEPPALYITHDEGRTFRTLEAIDKLQSRPKWSFFHAPFYAGHIHGLAVHQRFPERLFAGVEQGALVYTHDGGETWHQALVGYDIHRVTIDPAEPDRVYAGAGEGLFVSEDAGKSWNAVPALQGKYVHAVVFNPRDSNIMYVYANEENSPLYKTEDGGQKWKPIGEGLPAARPADTLIMHPTEPQILFYGGDIGQRSRIFVSYDAGETWSALPANLPKIWRLRAGFPVD